MASLVDFLNPAAKADLGFVAIAQSLDPLLQAWLDAIPQNQIHANLQNQSDDVLDFLAIFHYNVDNYFTTFPTTQKVSSIQSVITDKINKGTPQRIIDILQKTFLDSSATLTEWFQDAPPISPWQNAQPAHVPPQIGDPNTFRINTTITDETELTNAINAILLGKNVRSYFIGFVTINSSIGTMYENSQLGVYGYYVIRSTPV